MDIRDAFFEEICRHAESDSSIIVLSDDQGAFSLNQLRKNHPDRYINIGIAEQNAIDVAAGMALGGMKPFVYGITNFVSLRCAEQILVSVCNMELPVTIVASGGGLTYSSDGPTHHATQDIAVLRTMPGIAIYNPADAVSTAGAAKQCLQSNGPCYVRIEKGVLPQIYSTGHDFSRGFELFRQSEDLLIVSTGFATHTAFAVSDALLKEGIAAAVLDLYRLKPVDEAQLTEALQSVRRIAVIEEQTPTGGVFSIVTEVLSEKGILKPVKRFTLPDSPCFLYGSREWLHRELGLSAETIAIQLGRWLIGGGESVATQR